MGSHRQSVASAADLHITHNHNQEINVLDESKMTLIILNLAFLTKD